MQVNVLLGDLRTINTQGLFVPIYKNRDLFSEKDISFKFYRRIDPSISDCDILAIDSKYFKPLWNTNEEQAIDLLEMLSGSVERMVWFNTADSTGGVQVTVLPYVKRYFKTQLLFNRELYAKGFYGGRIYTDYYARNWGIVDRDPIYSKPIADKNMLQKIAESGNGSYVRANMTVDYARNTVSFGRKQALDRLKRYAPRIGFESKKKYISEIKMSRIVVSPFGWGEINIRDFECFASGSILLKPDISHVDTFPQYFVKGQTYVSYKWDFSDLEQCTDRILENHSDYVDVARAGQDTLRKYEMTQEGKEEIAGYIYNLFAEVMV